MTEYERGFIDGIKSKVSAELTPTLINVSKTMLEMLKPVLSTALENALNDNNAITDTDVQPVKRWVKLHDKHPDTEGFYLVCDQYGECEVAEYAPDIKSWFTNKIKGEIQYWIPLPEVPKDGDTK